MAEDMGSKLHNSMRPQKNHRGKGQAHKKKHENIKSPMKTKKSPPHGEKNSQKGPHIVKKALHK